MKLRYLAILFPLFSPTAVLAGEPVDTVRVLMDMAHHNAGDPMDGKFVQADYFSADTLLRFFSEDFTKAFATALLKTNERRQEMMIDWDPIIGGQDNCPLEDIVYGPVAEAAGTMKIAVTFKARTCFGDDSGKDDVSKVVFTLVKEELVAGSPLYLIDDIAHPGEASLKTTLAEIAQ